MSALVARRQLSARVVCSAAHSHAGAGLPRAAPARPDVRAGAAPHSMPSSLPSGAARAPHQPLPQIVDGEGLAPEAIAARMKEHLNQLQHQAIATHIEPVTYARVRTLLPGVKYHAGARCLMARSEDGALQRLPGTVGVVGAEGDAAAVDLAKLLLQHLGAFVIAKGSLSAANLQSVVEAAPALQVCDVVIVVAGSDAALPVAVAGLVDAPVVAVAADGAWSPPRGMAPVVVAQDVPAAAVTAARVLRTAATRALQIAESAAATAAAGHGQAVAGVAAN